MGRFVKKIFPAALALFLVLSFLAVGAVWAADAGIQQEGIAVMQEGGHDEDAADDHADTTDDHSSGEAQLTSTATGNVGLSVTLGIIFLVLAIIFVVAVVGAAGLGIIGLGAWQASSDD